MTDFIQGPLGINLFSITMIIVTVLLYRANKRRIKKANEERAMRVLAGLPETEPYSYWDDGCKM